MNEERSTVEALSNRHDDRSGFAKAYEEDTLFQLQERMLAKAKTKKFTPKQFAEKAERDWEEDQIVKDITPDNFEETPEPPSEEELETFF